jgi:hypothetical protein
MLIFVIMLVQDWRDMCNAYQVEKSDVPHRGKSGSGGKKRKSEG